MLPTFRGGDMNFEKMIDYRIGRKIKKYRKELELTQEQFCDKFELEISIDKFRLSSLENGRRHKKKNPHFLTEDLVDFFSNKMGISKKDFLFGNSEEITDLTKLIILNIFMNGSIQTTDLREEAREQNPIFDLEASDDEFFRLSYLNFDPYDKEEEQYRKIASSVYLNIGKKTFEKGKLKEQRKIIANKLESYDPFFFNTNSSKSYQMTMDGTEQFTEQSSLILRSLFGDFKFASNFLDRVDNLENYSFGRLKLRDTSRAEFFLDDYLEKKGNLSAVMIDWKEVSYRKFINAFNEYYKLYSNNFYYFLDEHLFSKSMKELSNSSVNEIFRGRAFTELLNDIYFLDEFTEDRMLGHNYTRAQIQKFTLIKKDSEKLLRKEIVLPYKVKRSPDECYDLSLDDSHHEEYNLSKYLYDFENMTVLYENRDNEDYKNFGTGLHLLEYFNIKPIK